MTLLLTDTAAGRGPEPRFCSLVLAHERCRPSRAAAEQKLDRISYQFTHERRKKRKNSKEAQTHLCNERQLHRLLSQRCEESVQECHQSALIHRWSRGRGVQYQRWWTLMHCTPCCWVESHLSLRVTGNMTGTSPVCDLHNLHSPQSHLSQQVHLEDSAR